MDRWRLKNVIILILLLVNGFLLGSLAMRKTAEQASFRRTAEQLAALFEADGMSLDVYAISQDQPPTGVSLTRDAALEAKTAAFLLGEAAPAVGSLAPAAEAEDFCRDFCRKFSYGEPVFQLDGKDTGTAAAVCLYGGLPVFNCSLTFTLESGAVIAASGTLLPETGTPAGGETTPLSAAGALVAFQKMRQENVVVASSIKDTRLCYELQTVGTSVTLTPAWKISADTADYYVNCYTGAVTSH